MAREGFDPGVHGIDRRHGALPGGGSFGHGDHAASAGDLGGNHLHLIEGADFAICHLEVPLSPDNSRISSFPRFSGPRELADGLAHAGFDACSTASNHTIDQGIDGALATRRILEEAGLAQSGIRASVLEVWSDPVYDVRGVDVAHISATYWYNGLRPPRGMEWISSEIDVDDILVRARRAKWYGADLVVVSMHCCVEYRTMPTARQLEDSHRLIESPYVDLVVTHHAHVVSPVERVGDKYVLHGLGNFLSGQVFRPETSDVFNVLLQLLDDGRLTDGQGRTVDFTNAVIIMTSNLGSELIDPGLPYETISERVMGVVRQHFRPEFLNRIDEIVVFERLTPEHLREIVDIQMESVVERLAARRIAIELDDAARDLLAEQGYDPAFGARPLKRLIQRQLVDPIATALLEGRYGEGDTVKVTAAEGSLVLS